MPFKPRQPLDTVNLESPQTMLRDFPQRQIKGVLDYQGAILDSYRQSVDAADIGIELPTGSGKTLIGLLIAEWRRRRDRKRCVYLCSTKQLAEQTASQARVKYGIDVRVFAGPQRLYDPTDEFAYNSARCIAITNYHSLFNTNPYFRSAHIVLFDDVHVARSHIADLWHVEISRSTEPVAFSVLSGIISERLDFSARQSLQEQDDDLWDNAFVDAVPFDVVREVHDEVASALDGALHESPQRFSWSMIRATLRECVWYIGPGRIVFRPLVPPTQEFAPFADIEQRIYMSATLGRAGDLERFVGRPKIVRLPIPPDFDHGAVGRRFFMFPGATQTEDDARRTVKLLTERARRAVILVPSHSAAAREAEWLNTALPDFAIFNAEQLENDKTPFVTAEKAVAVLAGRYEGLDFANDECRMLIVRGVPTAVDLQEQFLRNRLAAKVLLEDRARTRVIQAVGRCTRGDDDYSAVVIFDRNLQRYLSDPETQGLLPLELQAELKFGLEQSVGESAESMREQFSMLLQRGEDWLNAEDQIRAYRNESTVRALPLADELGAAGPVEAEFAALAWEGKHVLACERARRVASLLTSDRLHRYRSFWLYLAACEALLAAESGDDSMEPIARGLLHDAARGLGGLEWIARLANLSFEPADKGGLASSDDSALQALVEGLERQLFRYGVRSEPKFEEAEVSTLENLASSDAEKFELGLLTLGRLLGFRVGKVEGDASPDPWWLIPGQLCVVFEAHSGGDSKRLGPDKARQTEGHIKWVREKINGVDERTRIQAVLLSSREPQTEGASIQLDGVVLFPIDDFRHWGTAAVGIVRELRRTLGVGGDLLWRVRAGEIYESAAIAPRSFVRMLEQRRYSHARDWKGKQTRYD
jgi:hypothetical protein